MFFRFCKYELFVFTEKDLITCLIEISLPGTMHVPFIKNYMPDALASECVLIILEHG
jgi:hypothetical protein